MKYLLIAAVAASLLAGCDSIGAPSRVFDTGDSYGPAGKLGTNGGNGGVAGRARDLASRTTRPDTGN
jgi:hypothetical protein